MLKPAQFRQVYRQGRRLRCGPVQVSWRVNEGGGARLGLAIAKRQIRLATARNRIKRLTREGFRTHWQALPSVDLAISVQKPAQQPWNERDFKLALANCWQQLIRQCKR